MLSVKTGVLELFSIQRCVSFYGASKESPVLCDSMGCMQYMGTFLWAEVSSVIYIWGGGGGGTEQQRFLYFYWMLHCPPTEGGSEGVTTDSTEESDTTTEGASSDPSGSGSIGGLPTGAIWLIVGLGIAMLLVIICLLLIIIACMHCSKRKVKGECDIV